MKLPILASFLVLIAILYTRIKSSNKSYEKAQQEFWEKEQLANNVRKKPLTDLNYITIPEKILSFSNDEHDETLQSLLDTLNELSTQPIVNLTGITNTDLKLTYGTANITALTEYDNHYTLLARTLQKLAEYLMEHNREDECLETLEFAISTGSDISKSYFLLASLYRDLQQPEKIASLIDSANNIHSVMKASIVHTLQESYQSCG